MKGNGLLTSCDQHMIGLALVVGLGLILAAGSAFAASDQKQLNVCAAVNARASLTLGSTLTFPDASPETTPSISANEGPISITAKARTSTSGNVTLTALASNDLASGSDTIGITNITWTASGTGFVAGAMSKATAQTVGSWTGSGEKTGTLTFALANNWSYPTGNYTATVTYTLTAP